jgi:hypothetical protein
MRAGLFAFTLATIAVVPQAFAQAQAPAAVTPPLFASTIAWTSMSILLPAGAPPP